MEHRWGRRGSAGAAVAMGWAPSANEGVNRALRDELEAFALGAALDAHLSEHPDLTPDLAGVAMAVAELLASDGWNRAVQRPGHRARLDESGPVRRARCCRDGDNRGRDRR